MEQDRLVVVFDVFEPINALELKTRRRFSYSDIARETGLTRQAVWKLLRRESQQRVDVSTIAGFLSWFRREGIPATPNDFFKVVVPD